jgi:hypothetical protein
MIEGQEFIELIRLYVEGKPTNSMGVLFICLVSDTVFYFYFQPPLRTTADHSLRNMA